MDSYADEIRPDGGPPAGGEATPQHEPDVRHNGVALTAAGGGERPARRRLSGIGLDGEASGVLVGLVVLIKRKRQPVDLRAALFREFHLAYGETADGPEQAVVAILEREGKSPEAVVLYTFDDVREVVRFPGGEMPLFHPASDEAIKALMGSVSVDPEPSNGVA